MEIGKHSDMRRHVIDRATRQYPVADFEGACECAPPPVWSTFYFCHTPVKICELAISNSIQARLLPFQRRDPPLLYYKIQHGDIILS